jgi:hypothetical protein
VGVGGPAGLGLLVDDPRQPKKGRRPGTLTRLRTATGASQTFRVSAWQASTGGLGHDISVHKGCPEEKTLKVWTAAAVKSA